MSFVDDRKWKRGCSVALGLWVANWLQVVNENQTTEKINVHLKVSIGILFFTHETFRGAENKRWFCPSQLFLSHSASASLGQRDSKGFVRFSFFYLLFLRYRRKMLIKCFTPQRSLILILMLFFPLHYADLFMNVYAILCEQRDH